MARIIDWGWNAVVAVGDTRHLSTHPDFDTAGRTMSRELTFERRLSVGDQVDAFELPTPDGAPLLVDPTTAAATVVVFTSSGCPYALAWHDRVQDLARDYAPRGVRTVQVFSNDPATQPADRSDALARRVVAGELAGDVLVDAGQEQAQRFGATATPEVFVLDRQGVVRYHGAPDGNFDEPTLRAQWARDALDAVLAGRAVERRETSPAGCSVKWRVELLWWEGCPSHDHAEALLRTALGDLGRAEVAVRRVRVSSADEAEARHFPGSPTFQVGGRDLFPTDADAGLGCRIYARTGGRVGPLPEAEDLQDRLREVLARPWDLPGWTDFRRR
jgi:hypothetical protein